MNPDPDLQKHRLRDDGRFALLRVRSCDGEPGTLLLTASTTHGKAAEFHGRLQNEFGLRSRLDFPWAARPLALDLTGEVWTLTLRDPGGDLLLSSIGKPWAIDAFLRAAIVITEALAQVHARGLIHKDIQPANVLLDDAAGRASLTGFGLACELAKQHSLAGMKSVVAGSLGYIAPEQTGRMNRAIDSRSDLYGLGATFYEMLTGEAPFAGAAKSELIHCHVARQPTPPARRTAGVPDMLSDIVVKLLAKAAEDRYQTAGSLVLDLRRCLVAWTERRTIETFTPTTAEPSSRLLMPERLYGRDREIGQMRAGLREVAASGGVELWLVSGPSGVGKSSLVRELHQAVLAANGLYAVGKFDQYKRDVPYATLALAFQHLIRMVLGRPDIELQAWKEALREAVGGQGRLVASLIPELEDVIGPQAEMTEVSPRDTQTRFQAVFRDFVQAFARPQRPLVLVLDDLQWADEATLELLRSLLVEPAVRHVMLVAAYRSNEVGAGHPVAVQLQALRSSDVRINEISLLSLQPEDLRAFIADTLRAPISEVASLAEFVHEKTEGNPFFAVQFLTELADEGQLSREPQSATWRWDVADIGAQGRADNVVDLMIAKLGRVPPATRRLLEQLACFGTAASYEDLAQACDCSRARVESDLRPAVEAGLALHLGDAGAFAHDRVHEATYSLLTEAQRSSMHLRIGRLMAAQASAIVSSAFEVADQLNRGADSMTGQGERDQAAEVNLLAARRAKTSTAYASALKYVAAASAFLGEDGWERSHALTFEISSLQAECEFLMGRVDVAEGLALRLLPRAASLPDRASVHRLLIVLRVVRSDYAGAVATAIECLARFDIVMSAEPTAAQLDSAYEDVRLMLQGREIESLVDLLPTDDANVTAAMSVLSEMFAPACFTDERLSLLHLCHMVGLSLRHGLTPASVMGFGWFGVMIGHHYGHHADGLRFAVLSQSLVKRHGYEAFEAKSLFSMEIASVWTRPLDQAERLSRAAFTAGAERGDVAVACFACHHTVNDMLVRGRPLDVVQRDIDAGLSFARQAGFRDVFDEIVTQQRFVRALRGLTSSVSRWDGPDFDEAAFEARLIRGRMPTMIFWYWLLKAQLLFIGGDFKAASDALLRAGQWTWSSPVHVQYINYPFFSALVSAALGPSGDETPQGLARRLSRHRDQMAAWQKNCPATFSDKVALIDAEIARVESRHLDAARLYQQATDLAREHGFVQDEAIANELAAGFYASQGLATNAEAHLRQARQAYARWGALGKLRQLADKHAFLRSDGPPSPAVVSAVSIPVSALDLEAVVKVSQALSGEIMLDKLIETLLAIAIEQAGAERGLLIRVEGQHARVEAEATIGPVGVSVSLLDRAVDDDVMPGAVLNYVVRSRQSVLLDDASSPRTADADTFGDLAPLRSVLCVPLMRQASLVGVLYLENNLAPRAFTQERLAILQLLASQAAISLQNARLYAELDQENKDRRAAEIESARVQAALQESERRFRRMADATPDVIWITELHPERVVYASPSFERIWGQKVEDLYREPRLWVDSIHVDDRARIHTTFGEWLQSGADVPWRAEFRVVQPNGSVRWIHERGVVISDGQTPRVSGISTDITDRRLAESALRQSEERFAVAVAGSNDGIWDIDCLSGQMFMSDRAQELHGLEVGASSRLRSEWRDAIDFHPEDAERRLEMIEGYLEARLPAYDGEYRVRHRDGSFRWVRIRGLCIRDEAGVATRFAGSISDIDTQKRTEAALLQAQRLEAVGTLAGGIAHDFNNILGAILGFGEMARRDTRPGSRSRRDIECILTAGERGRSLVERILAFSRTGVGERVPVHVEGVVQEALTLIAGSIPDNVRMEVRLDAGRAAVLGDSTQMHQVLMNLATNAIQAMPSGGDLRVSVTVERVESGLTLTTNTIQPGEYVVLTVSDTGLGIAPEIGARIFDPFFTTKDVGVGTGLGLALVHGIVSELGGGVDVTTQTSAGSSFSVYLPRSGVVAEVGEQAGIVLPRGSHEQILVVDDEEPLVRLMTEMLTELGYVAVGFTSGSEALSAFRARPDRFDAVITDERMPRLAGTTLIRSIRALGSSIPIVLVTGYLGEAVVKRARDAGADALLGKPLSTAELAISLARLLRPGENRSQPMARSIADISSSRENGFGNTALTPSCCASRVEDP